MTWSHFGFQIITDSVIKIVWEEGEGEDWRFPLHIVAEFSWKTKVTWPKVMAVGIDKHGLMIIRVLER